MGKQAAKFFFIADTLGACVTSQEMAVDGWGLLAHGSDEGRGRVINDKVGLHKSFEFILEAS